MSPLAQAAAANNYNLAGQQYFTPEIITLNAGNGIVDAAPALMALDGRRVRFTSGGVYKINSTVALTRSPQWVFEEGAYIDASAIASNGYGVTVDGSQGNSIALTVDAALGAFSVTLVSVAGLSLNQRFRITSAQKFDPQVLNLNIGEIHIITNISGSVVTFKEPLWNNYSVSDTAIIYPLTMLDNIVFENMKMLGSETGPKYCGGLRVSFANFPRFYNHWAHGFSAHAIRIADCLGGMVSGLYTGMDGTTDTGYGIAVQNATRDFIVEGHFSAGMGHSISLGTENAANRAGQQRNITYRDFVVAGSCLNTSGGGRDGVDSHTCGHGFNILNGEIRGATGAGINASIPDVTIKRVKILGAVGSAIQLGNDTSRDGRYVIEDVEVDGCSTHVVLVNEQASVLGRVNSIEINGLKAKNFTGDLISWTGLAASGCDIGISRVSADASASTNTAGLIILGNFKRLRFAPCSIFNIPATGTAWRFNSDGDYYLEGADLGVASYVTGGANSSGSAVQMRATASATVHGDPLSIDVAATPTNTAKGFLLFDANTLLVPIGRVRGNALTAISSASGSTYITPKVPLTLTANGTVQIPANHYIRGIYMLESAGAAVTGGIRIGTSNGGTQVVTAQAVGANAQLRVADASVSLNAWTANQTLFIQTVTSWNGASVTFVFDLQYMGQP
jgi:hypothetical protein